MNCSGRNEWKKKWCCLGLKSHVRLLCLSLYDLATLKRERREVGERVGCSEHEDCAKCNTDGQTDFSFVVKRLRKARQFGSIIRIMTSFHITLRLPFF